MTMSTRILRLLLSTLPAIAAAIFGTTADAKFYGGGFDPLDFNGYAVFSLNSACETDGIHFQGVGGCLFNLAALYVTLDNGATSSDLVVQSNPPAGLGTPNSKLPDYFDMWSLYYQGGNLAWVDTGFIGGFSAADTADFPGKWWVQFVAAPSGGTSTVNLDTNVFLYNNPTSRSTNCTQALTIPYVHTYWDCDGDPATPAPAGVDGFREVATLDRPVAAVPEPGTLALLLGGAGAGWVARRRKQAA